jgi:hypothetical protein
MPCVKRRAVLVNTPDRHSEGKDFEYRSWKSTVLSEKFHGFSSPSQMVGESINNAVTDYFTSFTIRYSQLSYL